MITADLHTHTIYSHGQDTPAVMFAAARAKGITLLGFTEHSPRPHAYNYTHEYREHLTQHFPTYVRHVQELQEQYPQQVLLGMEMDWMEKEQDFIQQAITAYDFDYLLGSVHFLQTWGYDDDPRQWESLNSSDSHTHYANYFATLTNMARSGLFNIVAHVDLIKIFSIQAFRLWLQQDDALDRVRHALRALRDAGMALEISSAGLRKPCQEIYPCPEIMTIASELRIPIAFASDAHCAGDVAYGFDHLADYARAYGYTQSVWFCKGQQYARTF